MVRELSRTKQVELVDCINEGLKSLVQDITKEMRSMIKAEQKRQTKFIDDESDLEEQTRSILETDCRRHPADMLRLWQKKPRRK
ncbi:hypothetical protein NECAME_05740 [Necator americanus]|uniref:Uncharacterized protein n=1 Tax=Necator americanus TaxID=51031 RepID=W2TZC3_NECAM|nr:hypothetical protein NECAME_05740 [Necator americanus]ETN87019.1 hypothetical protein NECAME_05740 [Necator americanus]